LAYQSQLTDISLVNLLKEKRLRDHYLGFTTSGIHRDDLEMSIGSYPIRRVGSQGQNKTFLIALKPAQFSFLKKTAQSTPLLLFDDIFDKLDAERVRQIIQLVSEDNFGQIFITDTNREHIDDILSHMQQDSLIFHVENGEVKTP
jgi:DNA replication and repair protein RecF